MKKFDPIKYGSRKGIISHISNSKKVEIILEDGDILMVNKDKLELLPEDTIVNIPIKFGLYNTLNIQFINSKIENVSEFEF